METNTDQKQNDKKTAYQKFPPSFKRNIKGMVLIFLLGILIGYFVAQQEYQSVRTPTNTNMQSPSPTKVVDATVSWKTYISTKYGFEIKYPPQWKVDTSYLTDDTSEDASYYILLNGGNGIDEISINPEGGPSINPEMKKSQGKLSIYPTTVYFFTNNVGTHNYVYYDFGIKAFPFFNINVFSKPEHEDSINQILSTFKFLEKPQVSIVTGGAVTIPSNWKQHTATDSWYYFVQTTLSLPPEWEFSVSSEWTIASPDSQELWDYRPLTDYDGSSVIDWYQKYLSGDSSGFQPDTITKVTKYQKENVSYFEVLITEGSTGNIDTRYLYVQNGILHIVKPVSHQAATPGAELPKHMDAVLLSLTSKKISK